jgi:molecular chaperone DnaK
MSKEDIDRMMKDAESHREEDQKRHDEIHTKNQLDSMVYQTEKMLNENKDKLPKDSVKPVEDALASAKKAFEANDVALMKSEMEKLTQASHKLAEAMYKATGGQPGAQPGPEQDAPTNGSGKKDDVIDAEFKDVKN